MSRQHLATIGQIRLGRGSLELPSQHTPAHLFSLAGVFRRVITLASPVDNSVWLFGPVIKASQVDKVFAKISAQLRRIFQTGISEAGEGASLQNQPTVRLWHLLALVTGSVWRWVRRIAREIGVGLLPRPLPAPAEERSHGTGTRLSTPLQPYLPLVAVGIPLLALLLTFLFLWRTHVQSSTASTRYLQQAQEVLSLANQPNTDRTTVRIYLESALAQIDAALAQHPDQRATLEWREEVQRRLDLLNQTSHLNFIHTLYQYPAQSEPGRVLEVQDTIFVLDRGTNRLYHHRLDATGQSLVQSETMVLLQQGQKLDGKTVEALMDIVWLFQNNSAQLLALDQAGTLWAYTPRSGVQALSMPGLGDTKPNRQWRLSSYGGRLYVLVPQQRQVFRYTITEGAIGPPDAYFPPSTEIDFTGVRELAIDGYVYLLWENGLIRRFLGGEEQPFSISLPDQPLGYASALFARPDEETAHLYIVDRVQHRVVQLSKGGELIRQLKARDLVFFTDLRYLFADEAHGRFLVTDGTRLLLVEVPPLTM